MTAIFGSPARPARGTHPGAMSFDGDGPGAVAIYAAVPRFP